MIEINGKSIGERYYGRIPIIETYRGKLLVWQAIRSCFGNGYWINEFPWDNSEGWEN
jgi:hypothetical protein